MGRELSVSRYREFIFWPTMHCGPCIWSGLVRAFDFLGRPFWKLCKWRSAFKENAKAKHCQGKKRKRFSSFLENLSGASSLCVGDEVFWTEDLIEKTTKRLHDSYAILTLIEHDMSARLNCSLPNLVPRVFVSYYTCWVSEQRRREWECPLPWSSGRSSRFYSRRASTRSRARWTGSRRPSLSAMLE